MRKVLFTLFTVVLMVGFMACEDDGVDAKQDVFQCKVDGTEFKVEGVLAYGVKFSDTFNAYGVDADGNTMYISFANSLGEGTHTFNGQNTFALYVKEDGSSFDSRNNGGTGTATITEKTETSLKGTFSYKAPADSGSGVIDVTEGSFNVVFR